MRVALNLIRPSPHPVRTSWDESKMEEIAQSIREQGVIVPVKLRPLPETKRCPYHGWASHSDEADPDCMGCDGAATDGPAFEVVYGHRRIEAARRAGLTEVEAFVEGLDDRDAILQAATENLSREDMTPVDEGRAYQIFADEFGLSLRQIATKVGRDSSRISQMLDLLRQPAEILAMVQRGTGGPKGVDPVNTPITEAHVREVSRAADRSLDTADKVAILRKVEAEGLSGPQTRQIAESVAAAPSEQVKESLIRQPYSPAVHTPELVKARRADDPIYTGKAPKDESWLMQPAVKATIDALNHLRDRTRDLRKESVESARIGKMSPEARRFFAERLRRIAQEYADWAKEIDSGID